MALPGIADQKVKAFIDSGTVFRTQSTLRGLRSSDDLTGAGIGYSAVVLGHLSIDVMMAHPIGQYEASDRDQGMRFWTSFNAQF
jgi:hemolysin activation/secretion protein